MTTPSFRTVLRGYEPSQVDAEIAAEEAEPATTEGN